MKLSARSRTSRLFGRALVISASLPLLTAGVQAQDSAAAKTPGIYSDEQAGRGNGIFTKTCVECHTTKDMSNADFRLNWNGRTVFELFERIRTTMPESAPGSMTREEYADVTSYLLKLNGMPSGTATMPGDSTLNATKIDIPAPPSLLVSRLVSPLVSREGMLMRLPTSVRAAMLSASAHGAPSTRARAAHTTSSR
jgi:mono/diheme cytochrome c family protein